MARLGRGTLGLVLLVLRMMAGLIVPRDRPGAPAWFSTLFGLSILAPTVLVDLAPSASAQFGLLRIRHRFPFLFANAGGVRPHPFLP